MGGTLYIYTFSPGEVTIFRFNLILWAPHFPFKESDAMSSPTFDYALHHINSNNREAYFFILFFFFCYTCIPSNYYYSSDTVSLISFRELDYGIHSTSLLLHYSIPLLFGHFVLSFLVIH